MNSYSGVDKIRHLMVVIVSLVLMLTIIGIPVALILMQLERLVQIGCKE
jgi:hypothetical protein